MCLCAVGKRTLSSFLSFTSKFFSSSRLLRSQPLWDKIIRIHPVHFRIPGCPIRSKQIAEMKQLLTLAYNLSISYLYLHTRISIETYSSSCLLSPLFTKLAFLSVTYLSAKLEYVIVPCVFDLYLTSY